MEETQTNLGLLGTIKNRPEDFVVEELPLYEPCGEGEHVYLCVRKTGMSNELLVQQIASTCQVQPRSIGTAGRKDRLAVTTQLVSVHLPGKTNVDIAFPQKGIELLWRSKHTNKLRLGHLRGNRFDIRIRDIDPIKVATLQKRLARIVSLGLPNAFGTQRFGNDTNNHLLGAALFAKDYQTLVSLLLQGTERHHTFALGREYKKALDSWPFGSPIERRVLEALSMGKSVQQACKTIPYKMQKLWANALQSYVFNQTLQSRQMDGTWDQLHVGDLAWIHNGGGRTFEVREEDILSGELCERIAKKELFPTGPLWGPKMRKPSGNIAAKERAVLLQENISQELMCKDQNIVRGARRPLGVPVSNASISSGVDVHGNYIRLGFELPAGSYATVLIDSILHPSPCEH
jgi:tRNA pseudouridine13 synthase